MFNKTEEKNTEKRFDRILLLHIHIQPELLCIYLLNWDSDDNWIIFAVLNQWNIFNVYGFCSNTKTYSNILKVKQT